MHGVKRLAEPPKLWEVLAAAAATMLTIVVAAVSATWILGRAVSDTELRISQVEFKASEVELAVTTAIKDSEIRTRSSCWPRCDGRTTAPTTDSRR